MPVCNAFPISLKIEAHRSLDMSVKMQTKKKKEKKTRGIILTSNHPNPLAPKEHDEARACLLQTKKKANSPLEPKTRLKRVSLE